MASTSQERLKSAASAVNGALAKLEAAVEIATVERAASAAARENLQAELTAGWQAKLAEVETELASLRGENAYLKSENERLSNQYEELQHQHVVLQQSASNTVSRLNASVSQLDLLLEQRA